MEPKLIPLSSESASPENLELSKFPKYLNGHRLPENIRAKCSRELVGIPLDEFDPFHRNDKTFVVIGRGSQILYRFNGADSHNANEGGWRNQAISILTHGVFNYAMVCVVLLNILLMVSYPLKGTNGSGEKSRELVITLAELAFLLVYIVEFVLKVLSRGLFQINQKFSCLYIGWNWLDLFIISTGILMCFGIGSNLLNSLVAFRAFKLIPLCPVLLAGWDNVISKCLKGLLPVLYYIAIIMPLLGVLGLQIYMGIMKSRCVKNVDLSTTGQSWEDYAFDVANWRKTENGVPDLCGNTSSAQHCPDEYTCLHVGLNAENDFIIFDTFFWAELQAIQMVFQDFKESICEKIWATTGFSTSTIYILLCLLFGTFSMGAFVYGVLGKVIEKEISESNVATDQQVSEIQHDRSWKLTKFRDAAALVSNHKIFDIFITIVIVLDVCMCATIHFEMEDSKPELNNVFRILSLIIGAIYILELLIKLLASGFSGYFRSSVNRFDFFIVVCILVEFIADANLRALVQLRVLKLVPRWSALGFIFKVIYRSSVNTSTHLFGFLGIVIIALAIFGCTNFSAIYTDKYIYEPMPRWNTISVWSSARVVFRTFCGEWIEVLWDLLVMTDWTLPFVFIFTSFLTGNLLVTLTGITIILTTKVILESEKEKPSTPFEQIFFPITWSVSKLRELSCLSWPEGRKEQKNADVEEAGNQESNPKVLTGIQGTLRKIADNKLLGALTVVVLLVTSFSLTAPDNGAELVLDIIFLLYFIIEIGLRIGAGKGTWIGHLFDVLILLDTLITLIMADSNNQHGVLYLRSFRLLMLITRVQRIQVVLHGLCQQLWFAAKYIFGIFYVWVTFSIIGVSLFSGKFHSCQDSQGRVLDYQDLLKEFGYNTTVNKFDCTSASYKWNPAASNFDDVLNGLWSLYQVITFNGWLLPMYSAVDSSGMSEAHPRRDNSPSMILYFVGFVVLGVLYPFNILFGLLLSNFKASGCSKILATAEQFNEFEADKNEDEPKEGTGIPKPANACAQKVFGLVENPFFNLGICVIILVDAILIASDHHEISSDHMSALQMSQLGITLIYLVEMILKLIAWRQHYFKKWWNILDFIIVLSAVSETILADLSAKYFASSGILKLFRLLYLLRLDSIWKFKLPTLSAYTRALKYTFPVLLNIVFFYATIFFVYALLGTNLFRNPDHKKESRMYFETFDSSMMSLYQIGTQSGWEGVYAKGIRTWHDCEESETKTCGSPTLGLVYVLSFMGITFFTFVHLYLILVVETVDQLKRLDKEDVENEDGDAPTTPHSEQAVRNNTDAFVLDELNEFDSVA